VLTLNSHSQPGIWQQLSSYLLCYVLWAGLSALSFWILLQLRINLLDLSVFFRLGPWAIGAVDKFAILLLGLFWLGSILGVESYLRQGVERRAVWRRAARVFLVQLVILGGSYLLQILL
jgi:hypothetical protein